jgi:hypothetical protein
VGTVGKTVVGWGRGLKFGGTDEATIRKNVKILRYLDHLNRLIGRKLLMFIRFVRQNCLDGTSAREGFFCAAYELRSNPLLDRNSKARLEELLAWFRANLKIPKRFSKSKSKGHNRREFTTGLSWFRDDATNMVEKAFEMVALLAEHGYPTDVLRTDRVGYVIYEDGEQVVAEPFFDTPT